jgi:hypothetical protein
VPDFQVVEDQDLDHTSWSWRTVRSMKKLVKTGHYVTYFACSKKHEGCTATKKEIRLTAADQDPNIQVNGKHSHPPPTRRPTMQRIKKFIDEAIAHDRTAASIEHEVLSSPDFTSEEKASMPSCKQINQKKSTQIKKSLPCGDSLANIMVCFFFAAVFSL